MGAVYNLHGELLDPQGPAFPCGLIAKTFFTDTWVLKDGLGAEIPINKEGIAWKSDIDHKFNNTQDHYDDQWLDVEREDFIVWMRTAGLPNFRKLYGKIE